MLSGEQEFRAARPPWAGAHSQTDTLHEVLSAHGGGEGVAGRRDTRDKQNQETAGNTGKWG